MYCYKCGRQIEDNAKFCRYCGAAQQAGAAGGQKQEDLFGFQNNQSAPQPTPPPQYSYTAPDDSSSVGFGILSAFFPVVGFILWLVWRDRYPQRARSCIIGVLVSVALYVVMIIIIVALSVSGILASGMIYSYSW